MKFNIFKLEEVCELITDGSHSSPKAVTNGYKMLSVKDMEAFDFDYENAKQISEEDYIKLKKGNCQPKKNDVLIAKDGNSCLEYCFVFRENKSVVLLSSIAILRPNLDVINPYYLMYYLGMESTKKALRDGYLSGSAIPRVVLKDFKKFTLKIPNIDVQNRIVHLIRNINAKIENGVKLIDNLEQLSQTLFKHWFIDFEFPNEQGEPYKSSDGEMVESELGKIPKIFTIVKANGKFDISIGKTPSRKDTEMFSKKNGVTWVSIADLKEQTPFVVDSKEYLVPEAIDKYNIKIAKENTPLLSFKLTVGRVALASCEVATNEAIAHFNETDSSTSPEYTYLYLQSFNYESLGNTSSIATAVNSKIIKNMPFLVPDIEVLKKFDAIVKPLFDQMKVLQLENQKLERLRDTLLPKLLSGEIEIPDDLEVE